MLFIVLVGVHGQIVLVQAQFVSPSATPAPALPEAIYWKQQLFLIPYQWGSAADPASAKAVWLFLSKDRGANWQRISEATPQVKAFNYRAEGDGEYWFAVRTVDSLGRVSPAGPYHPELRVIVDTCVPRIEQFQCGLRGDGAIDVVWRCFDQNIDSTTWKIEAQAGLTAPWQLAVLTNMVADPVQATTSGLFAGGCVCQLPADMRPALLRASISDRAGNTATYQNPVNAAPLVAGPLLAQPMTSNSLANPATSFPATSGMPSAPVLPPAASNPFVPLASAAPAPTVNPPANQPWPAETARAPFRLWTGATKTSDDGVTAYGNPPLFDAPQLDSGNLAPSQDETRVKATYTGAMSAPAGSQATLAPMATFDSNAPVNRAEPYRQAVVRRLPTPGGSASTPTNDSPREAITPVDAAPPAAVVPLFAPSSPPKRVGSRTFALEYDLDQVGHGGVANVELWGTRDGGRNWRSYAQDDDNRSPLVVTVDEEGLHGFRIVVRDAGNAATNAPAPGDAPELWVDVDLRRPVVELMAIERGQGNQTDHLLLRWRADDNNLEPRPISLFYSSRPSGPWSAVATSLENTGEYAWRVERHVPARFYLRLEARDNAGNLAAFQTREPIDFSSDTQSARLRDGEPR